MQERCHGQSSLIDGTRPVRSAREDPDLGANRDRVPRADDVRLPSPSVAVLRGTGLAGAASLLPWITSDATAAPIAAKPAPSASRPRREPTVAGVAIRPRQGTSARAPTPSLRCIRRSLRRRDLIQNSHGTRGPDAMGPLSLGPATDSILRTPAPAGDNPYRRDSSTTQAQPNWSPDVADIDDLATLRHLNTLLLNQRLSGVSHLRHQLAEALWVQRSRRIRRTYRLPLGLLVEKLHDLLADHPLVHHAVTKPWLRAVSVQ
jgi:hypothetical protein